MVGALRLNNISLDDYIRLEQENNLKYEFHDGVIIAMAGGTINHGLIIRNLIIALNANLGKLNSSCFPLINDTKLYIERSNKYLYPDTMIVCEKLEKSNLFKEAITNASVIIEVLSKSTESYDRGDKFYFYQQLESFKSYILVNQYKAEIDSYTKNENGFWQIERIIGLNEKLSISFLDLQINLNEIYRSVEFENVKENF